MLTFFKNLSVGRYLLFYLYYVYVKVVTKNVFSSKYKTSNKGTKE